MQRKIFIGSSRESLQIAAQISEYFNKNRYVCTVWNNSFFDLNNNIYDTLVSKLPCFDYAIFIGDCDDFVVRKSNNSTKEAPRDNIYFEFGLSVGILTKVKTFFFLHNDATIASDLLGINVIRYKNREEIINGCQQILHKINIEESLNRINLLPSTVLALNYYRNFLEPIGEALYGCKKMCYREQRIDIQSWSLHIVLPADCNQDLKKWTQIFYNSPNLFNLSIPNKQKSFGVKFDMNILETKRHLKFVDSPQNLCGSFTAVEMVANKNYIGSPAELTYMKEKEVRNFTKTLLNLLESDPALQSKTQIVRRSRPLYDCEC